MNKQLATSILKDKNCQMIWGVAVLQLIGFILYIKIFMGV